jgi:glycerophosphoryl diester phosphodiesterase
LDIIETSDKKMVAAHDWKMWSRFTDYSGALPPSHDEFMKHKIYGDYTTLDLKGINAWFAAHTDATLVTDKVNDPIAFADQFVDKDRLVMELFSQMAVEEASRHGIQAMISQTPLMRIIGDKINYLKVNNVKYVALSRRILNNETKLLLKLKEQGIKVYVYNVNFDPGKDEKYVQENEIGLVYGMYADKWAFDLPKEKMTK